jgi:hypothetical protein
MFETINYQDLFIELGLDPIAKSGNLVCPFCNKRAFTPYDNGQAHCHACSWHGNAIMLWAEAKRIGRKEAFAELAELYHLKRIKVKKRTRIEALKSLASDLDFLAWARIYFAFYKSERTSAARLQEESGYSRSHFTKVMNGQFDMVSRKAWDLRKADWAFSGYGLRTPILHLATNFIETHLASTTCFPFIDHSIQHILNNPDYDSDSLNEPLCASRMSTLTGRGEQGSPIR